MKKLSVVFAVLSIITLLLSILSPWLRIIIHRSDNPAVVELNYVYRPLVFWESILELGLPMIIIITLAFYLTIKGIKKKEEKYVFFSSMLVLVSIIFFIGYVVMFLPDLVNSTLLQLKSQYGHDYTAQIEILGGPVLAVFSSILSALVAIVENI